jgi:hypothetical protein
MATDPSIYAQYLRPPKSVADFDREAYGAEQARYGSQASQLELLAGRRKLAAMDQQASHSARLQALIRGAGSEAGALEALRGAGEYAAAGEMESSMLGREKERADITAKSATTTKAFGEAQDAALKRYRGALDFVDTPQGVARWLQAQYADPLLAEHMQALGPLDQALQRIPQDPAGLQQWRQQAAMGMDRWMEQQRLQAADAERARSNKAGEDLTRRGQDVTTRGQDLVDKRTKETNEVQRETNEAKRVQDTEMKLSDDYRVQSRNFKEVADAHKRVTAALKTATTSPAATLASATSFMKMLDPGSVVRETELGMALAAAGVLDRAANYFTSLQQGKVLTAAQVADFNKIADQVLEAAKQGQRQMDASYRERAKSYGLRPELIVQELGQSDQAAPAPAAGGAVVDFSSLK